MSERKRPNETGKGSDDDVADAVLSADDTGLIANEKLITDAEIENPDAFKDG
jgi:hypothetical protein